MSLPGSLRSQQAPGYLPWLLLPIAASGCAALIYEVVWYQLLELAIGATSIALGVLLAAFMGGLCLGSIGYPRLEAPRRHHPLRVFAGLECGLGACALLLAVLLPLCNRFYVAAVGFGLPAMLLRAAVAAACLLPPTVLMGASLPALARVVESSRRGAAWLGWFYAANTAGAVLGCLLSAFYLLPRLPMFGVTLLAAGLNLTVAAVCYAAARHLPERLGEAVASVSAAAATGATVASQRVARTGKIAVEAAPAGDRWASGAVYLAIALSGATALGAEVIFTRLLSLLLGPTVYTFAILLAVFLLGMALGSAAGAIAARSWPPRATFAVCQLLLGAAIAWAAHAVSGSLPYWPVNPALAQGNLAIFELDLARALWALLPPTLLWGASFPLALAAVRAPATDSGRWLGRIYAANTGGAIAGALGFSLLLMPALGAQACERILVLVALAGVILLAAPRRRRQTRRATAACAVTLAAAFLLPAAIPAVPPELIAYGRQIMTSLNNGTVLATAQGRNAMIAYSRGEDGSMQFHVAGKTEASSAPYDMRLQRTLAHLPGLVFSAAGVTTGSAAALGPRTVLVVGFGAGVTAGSFTVYPELQRLRICEIEPRIPPLSTEYFGPQNNNVLNDPRTAMVYDDARAFLPADRERFDVITSDPIHPWVKGSATLYTREYFAEMKSHLNPGGLVTEWVPLYESDAASVRSELATFFQVFPDGTLWANNVGGQGYDMVLLGGAGPLHINVDALQALFAAPAYSGVADSLREAGFDSALDLLGTYAGSAASLHAWFEGATINRDANLRLEFLAGLSSNRQTQSAIYDAIAAQRSVPADLFTGSPAGLQALEQRLNQ